MTEPELPTTEPTQAPATALDIFQDIPIATLARTLEEGQNVMKWLRRLGDAGIWFGADFCAYHHEHPDILLPEDPENPRPIRARKKELVAHLAGSEGYGCSTRSIYNWIALHTCWPPETCRERRTQANASIFIQALRMAEPHEDIEDPEEREAARQMDRDDWVDRAILNGWSTRDMLRAYDEERGVVELGEPLKARVRAQRFTDEQGKHHLDVQPEPEGLFGFDCRREQVYEMTLREAVQGEHHE